MRRRSVEKGDDPAEQPDDLRMRPAQFDRDDPEFWKKLQARIDHGDYRVKPRDDQYPRSEILDIENERDLQGQRARRAERALQRPRKAAAGRARGAAKTNAKLAQKSEPLERRIRAAVKRFDTDDDGRRHSDREVERLLRDSGYRISRRKIAKYRRP